MPSNGFSFWIFFHKAFQVVFIRISHLHCWSFKVLWSFTSYVYSISFDGYFSVRTNNRLVMFILFICLSLSLFLYLLNSFIIKINWTSLFMQIRLKHMRVMCSISLLLSPYLPLSLSLSLSLKCVYKFNFN